MDRRKEGITIGLSTLAAWITMVPTLWLGAKPLLVDAVSVAMTKEIQEKIQTEVAPMNAAFIVLIRRDIAALRRQIAESEYKRDNEQESWSAVDAKRLVDLQLELESSQQALDALNLNLHLKMRKP